MLKYCSAENLGIPADVGLTSDCRRGVAIVEYLKNGIYCLLSLLSSLLWKPTPALFEGEGRGRGGEGRGKWRTLFPANQTMLFYC